MSSRGTPGSADAVMATIAAIETSFDGLADAAWWQLSSRQVADVVGRLQRIENRAAAAQVAATAEGVARGLHTEAGCPTAAAWLRGLVPVTPAAASTRGMLAGELTRPDMAPTAEAFRSGVIGVAHAAAVSRTMVALDAMPAVDPTTWAAAQRLLVDEGTRLDAGQLARAGTRLRHRIDPEAADRLARDEDLQEQARTAYLIQERTGMWVLRGLLPPVAGAKLHAALDPLAAPLPGRDRTPDPRSGQQRMADALCGLAEMALANAGPPPNCLPTRHGSAVRLVVTSDLDTLLAKADARGGSAGARPAVLETGEPGGWDVSPLTAQMLACDAEVVPLLLDSFGRPLDVGDSIYRFHVRIRRAIEVRDRHCTFTGCQAPSAWCHTHHLVAFGRNGKPGGPTSESNGTLLCGRHHRFVHAQGWSGAVVEGHVRWRPPRPGAPPEPANAFVQQFELKLRQLALRWLARNPELRDTS
jgi:Domain of unknown function (DUF222)